MKSFSKFFTSFLTIITVFIFISGVFVNSMDLKNKTNEVKSIDIEINDFNDFQILREEPEIACQKNSSAIELEYSGGSSTFFLMKYYCLNLDSYGNCTHFNVEVTLDYNYSGSIFFGNFDIILGSFYNESGDYCGIPSCNETGYPHKPAMVICKDNFVDAWSESGCEFRVFGYPNDTQEIYASERGVHGAIGSATFILIREYNELYCQIKKDGITQIDHTWYSGVTKPLNFIMIGCGIYGIEAVYAKAVFYDFSATLFSVPTVTIDVNFASIILPSFSIIMIKLIIFRKYKK